MLNPTDFASADDYVAAVKAEHDHAAHGDDMTKSVDHAAMLDLVARSEATHVAVSDGAWSDPSTWHEGRIPGADAKVLIPEAISVTYDSTSEASLFTVRVDGKVDFATDRDTLMKVDTFVVSPTGKLNIGTEADPVQQGVSAQIVIADNGPIDVAWDPMLLSRGVISHGEVQIHGQEKTSHLKVSTDAMKGDTQLVLEEAPEGWQVGDQLVLTGTHFVPRAAGDVYQGTQDEEVVITAIDGNVVTLDRPLTYYHDTPRDDLDAYVANYSRNVVIATENADDVPVHQRGHTMFMHSDNMDIRYAEFQELGRTDKSVQSLNPALVEDMQSDTNIQGRYAFHLHKTGTDGSHDPSIVIGNAVWGSPGWGFTHHQSNALMENNASYNTFGAGFVAETGDEIGAWRYNIAIKAEGVGGYAKNNNDAVLFDTGRTGDGFWFQGRLIEAEGNVAAGVNHGFVYFHRGGPIDADITVAADNLDQPEIFRYKSSEDKNIPTIQHFIDNEVLASSNGLTIIKSGAIQNHDVRSVIDGFTAWEVQTGVGAEYTAHYTFLNLDLLATESTHYKPFGIKFGTAGFDLVVNGATADGFMNGAHVLQNFGAPEFAEQAYIFIDFVIKNSPVDIYGFDPANTLILSSDDLVPGRLQLDFPWGDKPPLWTWDYATGRLEELDGKKTDSIGTVTYGIGSRENNFGQHEMSGLLSTEGYYTTADGRKIVIVEEYFADRATGEIQKIGIPIQLEDAVVLTTQASTWLPDRDAIYRGEIDLNSAAPVTVDDSATTSSGTAVVINVMANDSDPEGDALILDGLVHSRHGKVEANADGTVTYTSDRDFVGEESFDYWVTDDNGNYTRATVQVSVVADDGTAPLPKPEHVVYGSAEDETLVGSPSDDRLFGGGGQDVLRGGDGNDALLGGPGDDKLWGGGGENVLRGGGDNDALLGGPAEDRLFGSPGDDRLFGGPGDDVLRGGDDDDVVNGGGGHDRLIGGPGTDRLAGHGGHDRLFGGPGNDTLLGGRGNDVLRSAGGDDMLNGGGGNDDLFGGPGNDTLIGGSGDDILRGDGGDDVLNAGPGNDTLFGGAHGDRFVFEPGHGTAVVIDFEDGADSLDLTGFNFSTVQEARSFASNASGNLVFDFAGTEQLTLENMTFSQLMGNDILV